MSSALQDDLTSLVVTANNFFRLSESCRNLRRNQRGIETMSKNPTRWTSESIKKATMTAYAYSHLYAKIARCCVCQREIRGSLMRKLTKERIACFNTVRCVERAKLACMLGESQSA